MRRFCASFLFSPLNPTLNPTALPAQHYPSYCSWTFGVPTPPMFGDCQADAAAMRAELEAGWAAAGVDLVLYGHVHAFEATWPVLNSTRRGGYADAAAPVHVMLGNAGAPPLGAFEPAAPRWSAFRSRAFGYTQVRALSSTRLEIEFYANDGPANGTAFALTRSRPPARDRDSDCESDLTVSDSDSGAT